MVFVRLLDLVSVRIKIYIAIIEILNIGARDVDWLSSGYNLNKDAILKGLD